MMRPAAIGLLLLSGPALAQESTFSDLIDLSIGYTSIGPGIVLIEDDESSNVCKVDIPDRFFDGFAAGDSDAMASAAPNIVCVPSGQLSADAVGMPADADGFDALINASIGYVNIGPGIVLIEDDISSNVCRVQISDAYFIAHATGDDAARSSAAPVITCVPTPELSK